MADSATLAGTHSTIGFNTATGSITGFIGRLTSDGPYGPQLLADGLRWRVTTLERVILPTPAEVEPIDCHVDEASLTSRLRWVVDGVLSAIMEWRIVSLRRGVRVTATLTDLTAPTDAVVALEVSAAQWFFAGHFDQGVVQSVREADAGFLATSPLRTFYTIDHDHGSLAITNLDGVCGAVLFGLGGQTGVSLIADGEFVGPDGWHHDPLRPVAGLPAPDTVSISFDLIGNDRPYPAHSLVVDFDRLEDADTHYTALYASVAGCLGSYEVAGSSYPTMAWPGRAYGALHTFFDPDSWTAVKPLAFSGDRYLEGQAKAVLQRALSGITADGLIPHHHDGEQPVYVAISGAPQPGPNIFWTLAALDYVCATGDLAFFDDVWERGVVAATEWLVERFESERNLLRVDGPLWIDVFRQQGYTLDTNAIAIHLLEQVAQAAAFRGEAGRAERYWALAERIRAGLEALWNGRDHYVTARLDDWDQIFDRHDSGNYLAIAYGVADDERSKMIAAALDADRRTHPGGRGTWVSLGYYGAEDCYGGNTGDSACAMARLWWADAMARQRLGDAPTFRAQFERIRADLTAKTWLSERYDSDGRSIRAEYYHEYPATLDVLLREGMAGLQIGLGHVLVAPMRGEPLRYDTGRVRLEHAPDRVVLLIPGAGERQFEVRGLLPDTEFVIDTADAQRAADTDGAGTLRFTSVAGQVIIAEAR
jgi:hypothetical protein